MMGNPDILGEGPPGIIGDDVAAGTPAVEGGSAESPSLEDQSYNPCKVFVGGLSPLTTPDTLRDYMQQYGPVVDCTIMLDKHSGLSRGFGFVTFVRQESVASAIAREHQLDGAKIDIRRAQPRNGDQKTPGYDELPLAGKIFVGGLKPDVTEAQLCDFFAERFGQVSSVQVMIDKVTGNSRGFGFVYFTYASSAENAVGEHVLDGNKVEAKRCEPKHRDKRGPGRGQRPPHSGYDDYRGDYRGGGYRGGGPPPYGGSPYGYPPPSYGPGGPYGGYDMGPYGGPPPGRPMHGYGPPPYAPHPHPAYGPPPSYYDYPPRPHHYQHGAPGPRRGPPRGGTFRPLY
eukprot:GHVT01079882.1.p1 GENE.GHVT01079882.1~~GHVT01079882.1.p1  ORF type:complete len:342 (-),score=62.74 GHVT01079882.1:630-1655(-)